MLDHVSVVAWPTVIEAGLTEMSTVGGTGGVLLFPPPQACNARATAAATAGLRSRARRLVMIADMLLVLQVCYGAGVRRANVPHRERKRSTIWHRAEERSCRSDFTCDKIAGASNLFLDPIKLS